jgi:hypothetical protein
MSFGLRFAGLGLGLGFLRRRHDVGIFVCENYDVIEWANLAPPLSSKPPTSQ